jgi:hypothetical protein
LAGEFESEQPGTAIRITPSDQRLGGVSLFVSVLHALAQGFGILFLGADKK